MEQKPLINYPQIFLKFLLFFMIGKLRKKKFFLNKPFFAFFIIQVFENSDFPTWVYTISFGYLDRLP